MSRDGDRYLGEAIDRQRKLLDLLRRVESAMTKEPAFNPWDLGPSSLLVEVRQTLGHPNPNKKGQR